MSTSVSLTDILKIGAAGILPLNQQQFDLLESHYRLLLQWNRKMNLTTVTQLPEAATRHYGESLFLAASLTTGRVVDVGSGAGFPGLVAAVARPDCHFDLIESNQRKAVFLREASRALKNITVQAVRAERVPLQYDWLISRAVNPSELMSLRIAKRFAILLGEDDSRLLPSPEILPLPWGERRVLALGCFT